ncbi:glycoside hydrolase family 73 protein [Blattabacterium cuenoti]|uniref:glycoside hydrolase family 73 protein n=1 Tax=Blattabacterium cuenoti TaxID=1653831 RepID=UPI001EEB9EDE|nr:glucosaminidase domain-containing protein [Blattabacterium cuenoti]
MLLFLINPYFLLSKNLDLKEMKKEKEMENVIEYVKKYAPFAIEEMKKFGIPASIKLGQGIVESSSGTSQLSKATNNHFGIKCGKSWIGDVYYHDDDLPKECFRKYSSVKESFQDHSKLLQKPRYSKLFNFHKNDYQSWAVGLKQAGYATSLNYADLLINQIEKYLLWKFDEENPNGTEEKINLYLESMMQKKDKKNESFFMKKMRFFYKIFLMIKKKIELYRKKINIIY